MKSVIVFVENFDEYEGSKYFTESTEFGGDSKYVSAAQFVQELQKMYTAHGKGKFSIKNVVIG